MTSNPLAPQIAVALSLEDYKQRRSGNREKLRGQSGSDPALPFPLRVTYTTRPSQYLSSAIEERLENIPGNVLAGDLLPPTTFQMLWNLLISLDF
uniref:Uncharacterized protein n=1 Tax=Heterorhabditis bacteriophora TaxID=37862 RepID=A0A1I7X8A6_HETBA